MKHNLFETIRLASVGYGDGYQDTTMTEDAPPVQIQSKACIPNSLSVSYLMLFRGSCRSRSLLVNRLSIGSIGGGGENARGVDDSSDGFHGKGEPRAEVEGKKPATGENARWHSGSPLCCSWSL
jgi:hypothetical protein